MGTSQTSRFAERFATTLKHPDLLANAPTALSLINYGDLFSNISTKTPSPRTLSAKKNSLPMPQKNLSIPLSIALSSTDSTFDDSQADALDEDTSNASVECSADNADKDSADFDDEKDAADESDYLDGQERAKDPHDTVTTSLVSTESHNKEMNLPEGFAHAKERSVGLVLVELNKEEKKFLSRVLALKGLAREKATAQWTTPWCVKLTTMPWINFLPDLDSYYRLVARLVP
ncbi:hypothetical protein E4U12_002375 [Claviceps purpurea]|nr:hypothetical protein E4U12_002375 [Claviceps purpurea]